MLTELPALPTPESYGFRNGRPDPKQPLFAVDDVGDYARACYDAGKAAATAEARALLRDIDAHMRRMWNERKLPAECWPPEFIRRIEAALQDEPAKTGGT